MLHVLWQKRRCVCVFAVDACVRGWSWIKKVERERRCWRRRNRQAARTFHRSARRPCVPARMSQEAPMLSSRLAVTLHSSRRAPRASLGPRMRADVGWWRRGARAIFSASPIESTTVFASALSAAVASGGRAKHAVCHGQRHPSRCATRLHHARCSARRHPACRR